MATDGKKVKQADKEVHISLEDQQRINKFARLNSRLNELKEDIKAKSAEVQTIEDASGDLMMLEDEEKVPYKVGEVFVYMSQDEAQEMLEKSKSALQDQVGTMDGKAKVITEEMVNLKTHLYAKFGDAINLEADEE